MNKENVVDLVKMDCPFCDKIHKLEKRKRMTQAVIRDEIVDYEEIYFFCPLVDRGDNEFVPAGLMDENLQRARDSYRKKKGLSTSG